MGEGGGEPGNGGGGWGRAWERNYDIATKSSHNQCDDNIYYLAVLSQLSRWIIKLFIDCVVFLVISCGEMYPCLNVLILEAIKAWVRG